MSSTMFIATGSDDGSAKIWSFDEKRADNTQPKVQRMATLKGHIAGITSISWSPLGMCEPKDAMVLTSSKDRYIKVWRPFDQSVSKTGIVPHESLPRISKASGAADEEDKKALEKRHTDYVNRAEFKPVSRDPSAQGPKSWRVLSCSDDKTGAIWKLDNGTREYKLKADQIGHAGEVSFASWSPDGNRILTSSYDMYCILWSARNGHHMKLFPQVWKKDIKVAHQEPIWTARFSPDGGTEFVTASKDGTARIWDVSSGQGRVLYDDTIPPDKNGERRTHDDVVFDACWNASDPNQIVTCSLDATSKIWDKRSGKVSQVLKHHSACVWSAVFGNDPSSLGRMVLTCSHDMTALVYDQRLGMPKNMLSGHTGVLWQASFSADDQWVVTCSEDRTARLWNLSTGARRPPCHMLWDNEDPHTQAVTCAAFMEKEPWM